ncbi:NHLP leader peptide family RiPP precursor, partial [Thiocystis minor]|uniref:NHLP leader peptide family RiPP precursor n=1 Tax=Thiocystis minor TaxID=61597 RepID=UPI001911D3EF
MNDQARQYQQLIAKCWADDAFKQRLLADPVGTLAAEGIEVPAGVSVKVAENTEQVFHLVIPACPTDLSDGVITGAVGGVGW